MTREEIIRDIHAAYLLVSRRLGDARVSLRAEDFGAQIDGRALTAGVLWTARDALRAAVEVSRSGGRTRGLVEVRYYFGGR